MNACTEKLYPFNAESQELAVVVRMTMDEAKQLIEYIKLSSHKRYDPETYDLRMILEGVVTK